MRTLFVCLLVVTAAAGSVAALAVSAAIIASPAAACTGPGC